MERERDCVYNPDFLVYVVLAPVAYSDSSYTIPQWQHQECYRKLNQRQFNIIQMHICCIDIDNRVTHGNPSKIYSSSPHFLLSIRKSFHFMQFECKDINERFSSPCHFSCEYFDENRFFSFRGWHDDVIIFVTRK